MRDSATRVIDQHLTHETRGEGEEVCPALDGHTERGRESYECFVNERCRLKGVADALSSKSSACDAAQFVVDQGDEAFERRLVA